MKPKVIVNMAMSADGKIALPDRREVKISGEEDFKRVHEMRDRVDAILVGIGTVLADDPKLTVKEKFVNEPNHPVKVVLDSQGRVPEDAHIFKDSNYLIATTEDIDKDGFVKCGDGDRVDLNILLDELEKRSIHELLVEGGGETVYSFFEADLVDELYLFVGSMIIGGRNSPTPADGEGAETIDDIVDMELLSHEELDDGILLKYQVLGDD